VDIVKKVVNDLIKYGSVQRGFLGAMFLDATGLTNEQKERANVPTSADGIYITNLVTDGAAKEAGIQVGDQIRKINDVAVNSGAELQEQLSNFRPGDKINVTVSRNGQLKTFKVTLKNNAGNYDIVKPATMVDKLGAQLETLDPAKAKEFGLEGGVVVRKINQGALNDQTRMSDGFIITKVNGNVVKNLEDLKNEIGTSNDITITGVYPGYNQPFEYPLSLNDDSQ
jgi:S1-C subfamily serine protease